VLSTLMPKCIRFEYLDMYLYVPIITVAYGPSSRCIAAQISAAMLNASVAAARIEYAATTLRHPGNFAFQDAPRALEKRSTAYKRRYLVLGLVIVRALGRTPS